MVRKSSKKGKVPPSFSEDGPRMKALDLNTFFIFGAIILVLSIGLFAIFSPDAQNAMRGNPACGKIVVAAQGPSLKANVSSTLSDARYFLVINPISKKLLEVAKNPYIGVTSPGADVAYFIAGKGEEAVIAGSIGHNNYNVLNQFGIRTFGGYSGRVRDAIDLYRQARISQGPLPVGRASPAGATPATFSLGQNLFRCPRCNWTTSSFREWGTYPLCPNCRIPTIWDRRDWMGNNVNSVTPVVFGFAKQAFICPACNWRMESAAQGNSYPNCPNCGIAMAKDMNEQEWSRWKPLGLAANSVPLQNNLGWTQSQPHFWQGPESSGFFICPNCNWRMYAQKDMGQYPRCPNCRAMMARGGVSHQNSQASGFNAQGVAFANQTQASPTYPDATVPYNYREVCPNCYQILSGSAYNTNSHNQGGTQATWGDVSGGGTCVLR